MQPVPREVLVPELPEDADILTEWLSGLRGARVALRVPQRGDKLPLSPPRPMAMTGINTLKMSPRGSHRWTAFYGK